MKRSSKEKLLIKVEGLEIFSKKESRKRIKIIIRNKNSDWKLNGNDCGPERSKIIFIKD